MFECLVRCEMSGSLILVAPEHRLSLDLKWHELRLSSKEKKSSYESASLHKRVAIF